MQIFQGCKLTQSKVHRYKRCPQEFSGCYIIYQHLCGMVVDRLMEAAGVAPASRLEEPRPALGISVRWRMSCCKRPRGCVM